eukprot:gene13557-18193_t
MSNSNSSITINSNDDDDDDWNQIEHIGGKCIPLENDIVINNDDSLAKWIPMIFSSKPVEKVNTWIKVLQAEEFEKVQDLLELDNNIWDKLPLALAVKSCIQSNLTKLDSKISELQTSDQAVTINSPRRSIISQVDCIVMDISGSMKARSKIDVDKTREDVSKMLFHTLIDKLITLELSHAVGLLAFGEFIVPVGITTTYERFHDELGRLDANQGSTKLYDSILQAAEMIDDYVSLHVTPFQSETDKLHKRIFVLTDGEDNASKIQPWELAKLLQERSMILDAIPVANRNGVLQSLCSASGGLCFEVVSQEQGINLFEREAVLHVSYREENINKPPAITCKAMLTALEINSEVPIKDITSAVPSAVFANVMKREDVVQMANSITSTSSIPNNNNNNNNNNKVPAAIKRILKEYVDIINNNPKGWKVFVSSDDTYSWKAVLSDLPPPYQEGNWLLTVNFPPDYPFRPPKIRFLTPIYHCNISTDGHICLDLLKDQWNPSISISKALESIRGLVLNPNAMDPLDAMKGALYKDFQNDGDTKYMNEAIIMTKEKASESFEQLALKYNLE